jgi:uncharacterized protein (TIGR02145 family)
MSRAFILLSVCFFFLENLLGQEQQQSLPSVEQISSKRTNYNLEEIKVRWKKAALENCAGVPCVVTPPFTCGTSTVSDYDGNSYNTVSIGSQCWLKENLKVTKYNDGTLIGDSTNSTWGTALIGARTGYDVNLVPLSDYVGTFGYLYNWYAVNDSRKLCPAGWHVPTDSDWNKLVISLHSGTPVADTSSTSITQSTTAGTTLKSQATNTTAGSGLGWNPGSPGTNTSGFTALPGGYRLNNGFFSVRDIAFFWSASEFDNYNAWLRYLNTFNGVVLRIYNFKTIGGSVRCLRD